MDSAPFVRLTEPVVFFASQYYSAVLSFAFSISYIATITPYLSKYQHDHRFLVCSTYEISCREPSELPQRRNYVLVRAVPLFLGKNKAELIAQEVNKWRQPYKVHQSRISKLLPVTQRIIREGKGLHGLPQRLKIRSPLFASGTEFRSYLIENVFSFHLPQHNST